jgi:hypothetical protein
MTDAEFFTAFRRAVSNERIDQYIQRGAAGGDENLLTHYAWNMALSEALYIPIQCLEVSLRNAIHSTLSTAYNNPYWYDDKTLLTAPYAQADVAKAKQNIRRLGRRETPGQVVATLTLGFWTGLFSSEYQNSFWPKFSTNIFSSLPKTDRIRKKVSGELNVIRKKLRNRIMHHEPIWHQSDLSVKYRNILKYIYAINPAMAELNTNLDSFQTLYFNQMQPFKTDLQQRFPRIGI